MGVGTPLGNVEALLVPTLFVVVLLVLLAELVPEGAELVEDTVLSFLKV